MFVFPSNFYYSKGTKSVTASFFGPLDGHRSTDNMHAYVEIPTLEDNTTTANTVGQGEEAVPVAVDSRFPWIYLCIDAKESVYVAMTIVCFVKRECTISVW